MRQANVPGKQRPLLARLAPAGAVGLVVLLGAACSVAQQETPPTPPTPPARQMRPVRPPSVPGLKVLFSGKESDLQDNWTGGNWKISGNAMVAGGGSISSKEKYLDCYLHLEFKVPYMPNARGQGRGNSGVFLQNAYEIQVLDSYGKEQPGTGDCAAVYNQAAPLINACKPPLEWQSYDIIFRAARWDDEGKLKENPRVTVIQNGIVVQNNQEIRGQTASGGPPVKDPGSIQLQDHGNPIEYRNVWVLPLPAEGKKTYE